MANSEPSLGIIEVDLTKLSENSLQFPFVQEPLAFDKSALEPYIDTTTMDVHYNKHHKTYTEKFNAAVEAENATKISIM
ncbi:MAG TPA: superoxide dismutase, partial [Bacteroidota bacterium]|nr:superoxide dismutase [Bacteroidota bacterium]